MRARCASFFSRVPAGRGASARWGIVSIGDMTAPRLVWIERDGIPLIADPGAHDVGVTVAFSTRLGGASDAPYDSLNLSTMVGDEEDRVRANRDRLATAAGFEPGSVAFGRQVHGATIVDVQGGSPEPVAACDALVALDDSTTVGVMTADCVPVLLASATRVAAVHAGWRGLVAGVIEAAVQRLGTIERAWVGPSIRACCYEVGSEVVAAFAERGLPSAGRDRVDPGQAAVVSLTKLGVTDIAASSECTSCDSRFFSHRRDGTTGRQGALIARGT